MYWLLKKGFCIHYMKYGNPVKLLNGKKENYQYLVSLSGKWYVNVNMKKVGKEIKVLFFLREMFSSQLIFPIVFCYTLFVI